MAVDISYPLIIFCMIKNLQSSTAPKCPPVINSSRLRNHKTGLNCWSIRANCLPTSKAEPERAEGGGGMSQQQRLCGHSQLRRVWLVAWTSRAKLWPQNCCLRLSWWQSLRAADTGFVHIQISQTVARVRRRSDTTVMYRGTCLGISLALKTHTRKWRIGPCEKACDETQITL